jgi:hypothetical protein
METQLYIQIMGRLYISTLLLVALAFPQANRTSSLANTVWEPPSWGFLDPLPTPTVPKEMVSEIRVSGLRVALEETELDTVKMRLGGTIGQSGDAGDADAWLCYYGTDRRGRWALWLESGEVEGGRVGVFQLQRIDKPAELDHRCRPVREVMLPIAVRLGSAEADVRKALGVPTIQRGERIIYVHEHHEIIRGEPFTSFNVVAILFRGGVVWGILVSRTTTS